jgi:hypothetical protein
MEINLWGLISCGQNLDVKELRERFAGTSWLVSTVTASAMIADLELAGKVGCHNGLVEIP